MLLPADVFKRIVILELPQKKVDDIPNLRLLCFIVNSMDSENCELLNRKTETFSISSSVYDTILNNFEEGVIGEDELVDILAVLGKTPADFGIEITVVDSDDMDFLFP